MQNKKILLIITGSVAAYKALELLRDLQKKGAMVSVILTKAAQEFVTKLQVSSLCDGSVFDELFDDGRGGMAHIDLSRENDLILVAPATADFLAKMARGFGDDLASTTILAANKPIIVAPAMNEKMWFNKANLENISWLKKNGVSFIEPDSGQLACGEIGVGKMKDPQEICVNVAEFFELGEKLRGKKIIVTAGGTREFIDPVRFIGNESSGRQGILLAEILTKMGAEVLFVAANIFEEIALSEEKIIRVKSAHQMFEAVKENLDKCDVFIGCAAVGDFCVENIAQNKIKKDGDGGLTLNLKQNIDILNYVGNCEKRPALVIGFAAESEDLVANGKKKLLKKNCDFILANDVNGGEIFGSQKSQATLIGRDFVEELGMVEKKDVAKRIAGLLG